ncbi:TetR/AcrR family transcriptional regulator [Streptoalloteichus tenebrarius]|uniref:TetR/AcrR family transcriptional regulator n=1 Tax=Streptoalloteichus tenebrarius (strain ATCC 17920 / DSM 40477 / JCM 4838 / CBS 697.72 / NBRC 16177 / NCIMB 11028 / NRRL B-12390 / A12253. 1 / ISP 5477) TaxID=1933 RepID=UPI0020A4DFCF|nr:TetR/AcrR family transcriptional regulator [Streptoalloteichus tenebrarius]
MRSRRTEYSASTRQALVDSAVELFTERGYAGAALDEVARRARVTKGALYHHFGGKQALFEAAHEAVETDVVARLARAMDGTGGPWETVKAGLRAFLDVCLEPAYQRIVVREAPVVLGRDRSREADERFTFGVVRQAIAGLAATGELADLPVEALARVVFGALSAGATMIADSPEPHAARVDVERCVEYVLEGLRRP